ncbi:MAG: S49 family peptidase [Leptospira sp.]|nr:S49 family peptidase [Leptospira sp.]
MEFPSEFETSHKSFLIKKLQGKSEHPTRLEFLYKLYLLEKNHKVKEIWIYLPPLNWTVSEYVEVYHLLEKIKNTGKTIHMFANEGGTGTLLLLSVANQSTLGLHSEFNLMLPSVEPMFYGDFLKFWGVSVEAFASGPYKSFAESFTRSNFSKEAKKNISELVENLQNYLLEILTKNGKIKKYHFFTPIHTSESLKSMGFIDKIETKKEWSNDESKFFKDSFLETYSYIKEFKIFPRKKSEIVILPLSGPISGGDYSQKTRDSGKIESYSVIATLESLLENKNVKAVILEISSPGGSAFHSEQIYQAISTFREKKPITAYFKDTVASGGYYIAQGTSFITANPVTVTGSIGAVMIRANLQKLYKKLKLNKEAIGFYPLREIQSEFVPLSKESRSYLQKEILRVEGLFYQRVSDGRQIPLESLNELGKGRVYLPKTENRIVDKIGGLLDSIQHIKQELALKDINISYELPAYQFKNKIPIMGSLTEQFDNLSLLNEISYLTPFTIRFSNRR